MHNKGRKTEHLNIQLLAGTVHFKIYNVKKIDLLLFTYTFLLSIFTVLMAVDNSKKKDLTFQIKNTREIFLTSGRFLKNLKKSPEFD